MVSALLLSGLGVSQAAAAAGPVASTPADGAPVSLTTSVLEGQNAQYGDYSPWQGDETYGMPAAAGSALSGSLTGVRPTGSVTYDLFPNTDCTGDPTTSESVAVSPSLTPVGSTDLLGGANVQGVAMSSTGLLATADYGSDTVSVFSVGSAGNLTEVPGSPYDVAAGPHAVAFSSDGSLLAVGSDASQPTVSVFAVDPTTAALTQVTGSPITGGFYNVNQVAFSPDGGLLAFSESLLDRVHVYTVDAATGAVSEAAGSPVPAGGFDDGLAFSPDGKWLATANSNSQSSVSVFSVDSASGALAPVAGSPFPTGNAFDTQSVVFTAGGLLITRNLNPASMSVFKVDSATGALSEVPGSPFDSDVYPVSIATSPDGGLLALTDGFDNALFDVDQGTGALTELGSSYENGGPGIAFSPDGQWFANAGGGNDEVTMSAVGVSAPSSSASGILPAGSYAYQASYSGDENYAATTATCAPFDIAPTELDVLPNNPTVTYGTDVTDFTAPGGYNGFVGDEDESSLDTVPTCTSDAPSDVPPVGTYTITCSGGSDPNYSFVYPSGSIEVDPAPLTVDAPSTTIEYGDAVTSKLLAPHYVGLENHDPAPATPATCTVPPIDGVGVYPVSCSDAADPNYTIGYQPGELTVTKAPVTVVAPSKTIRYGDAVPTDLSPALVSETSVDLQTPATCGYANGVTPKHVGTYAITCSGGVDPNHRISYQAGTLTILPATLVVAAPSPTITAGDAIPALPASYSGFVNGDTVESLTAPATCTSTATGDTPDAGSYPTTCTGAVDPDYSILPVAGILTVSAPAAPATPKGSVTVVAPSATVRYGDPVPTNLTPTLVAADTVDLDTPPTCSYAGKQTPTDVGTYAITCTGAKDSSDTISYQPGVLTILPATLVVGAPSPAIVAGTPVPSLHPSYTGFVNGDSVGSLTSPATCTSTASGTRPAAGSYAVTCAGATDANYSVMYVAGTLNVLPAPLSVGLVYPDRGPRTGGTVITITGGGFGRGDRVYIGQGHGAGAGAIRATTVHVLSASKLTAITGGHALVGHWHVFVVTPAGDARPTVNTFAYTRPRA